MMSVFFSHLLLFLLFQKDPIIPTFRGTYHTLIIDSCSSPLTGCGTVQPSESLPEAFRKTTGVPLYVPWQKRHSRPLTARIDLFICLENRLEGKSGTDHESGRALVPEVSRIQYPAPFPG